MNRIGASVLLAVLLAAAAITVTGCGREEPVRTARGSVDVTKAKAIAEHAFVEATRGKVTRYSVGNGTPTNFGWEFLVRGEGEFERPGNHWIVRVDRRTGSTVVQVGE